MMCAISMMSRGVSAPCAQSVPVVYLMRQNKETWERKKMKFELLYLTPHEKFYRCGLIFYFGVSFTLRVDGCLYFPKKDDKDACFIGPSTRGGAKYYPVVAFNKELREEIIKEILSELGKVKGEEK